mgnify:CR=1
SLIKVPLSSENKIIKLAIGNKSTINRFLINGMNKPNSMSIIPGCNKLLIIVISGLFKKIPIALETNTKNTQDKNP